MTTTFAALTTMRVGGPIANLVTAQTTAEVLDTVRQTDARNPADLLVFGGGSNIVVGDGGWPGTALQIVSDGLRLERADLIADAGCDWDRVVVASIDAGLSGLEPLSGIPGSAGATPVQNVGAYGVLTQDVLRSVEVYDRHTRQIETWSAAQCEFGSHRHSIFKHTDRYVVLTARFRLQQSTQSMPIKWPSLFEKLGIVKGGTAPTKDVRAAVLELRGEKHMIYDPSVPDTRGTGSFFINHVTSTEAAARAVAEGCPTYPDPPRGRPDPGRVKLPSGWMIEHAGFPAGYGADWGRGSVRLSSKHALAVSNHSGDATTAEVMAFAAHIREGVERAFGLRLGPECHLINCSFDDAVHSR